MASALLGKIVFYYMVELIQKGLQFFRGKPNYKKPMRNVLVGMNNTNFVKTISGLIDAKRGIDSGTAYNIIKTSYVQNLIDKELKNSKDYLDKTELENELKTIIVQSWNELADKAVEKVKNDLK